MNKQLLSICLVLLCACTVTAHAQTADGFPALSVDKSAIRSLDKAEELYELGNFKRAYFIYRNELSPIGDKYAQYMVGYMHLMGQAVEQDRVLATAWYRLAAERGTREFVLVHNQLLVSLTPEQLPDYERRFLDLRKQYGDLVILMRAIREDVDQLRMRTGSRLGGGSSPITMIDVRKGGVVSSADEYYDNIERRLKTRLQMMSRYVPIETDDYDLDSLSLVDLEERVHQVLESAD